MPRLIIEEGMQKGREFRFTAEGTVGRGKDCLVTVDDPRVSLRHARIVLEGGRYILKDQASRNGTFLNGERIQAAPIQIGDKIRIGGTLLAFAEDPKGKWAGRTLGGYELLDIAGQGGMGTVYKARQVSLDRIVALKLIHEHLMRDPKYVERFLAEAKAAATLNHPGIVQVHDVGCEDGTYFFSMEYIDGVTLAERIQKGPPLAVPDIARIGARIAEALAYAHARGIIHRDVKPENILLAADGEPKLADLGVAKQSRAVDASETSAGGKRVLVGTPAYIAPEEALGQRSGPASDIYSLGATLYHALAGRPPFISASPTEIIKMHIANVPPEIRRYNPRVPPTLCRVVSRMMEKNPADRFADAHEASHALARAAAAGAPAGPSGGRLKKVLAAAGVFAALVAVAVVLRARPPRQPDAPDGRDADAPAETAQDLMNRAAQAHDAGRFDEAEDLYQRAVARAPDSLWAELAEGGLRRLRAEREERRVEALRRQYARILEETQGSLAGRHERLGRFRASCVGTPLAKTVDQEFERTGRALAQEKAIQETQRLERERLERAFQEGIDAINAALRAETFADAWATLDALQSTHDREPWREPIAALRRRVLDQMNAFLRQERLEWDHLRERRRFAEGWSRTVATEQALAGTPLAAQAALARQRVESEIAAAFAADAPAWEEPLRAFRFREALDICRTLADAYAGTPLEKDSQRAAAILQALSDMHGAAIARIQALSPVERKTIPQDAGRPARVVAADEKTVTLETVPAGDAPSVRWRKAWEEMPPHEAYTIYENHLDKRRRQTHAWLYVFCNTFGLAEEAARHAARLDPDRPDPEALESER